MPLLNQDLWILTPFFILLLRESSNSGGSRIFSSERGANTEFFRCDPYVCVIKPLPAHLTRMSREIRTNAQNAAADCSRDRLGSTRILHRGCEGTNVALTSTASGHVLHITVHLSQDISFRTWPFSHHFRTRLVMDGALVRR